jgi:hypothetical protein
MKMGVDQPRNEKERTALGRVRGYIRRMIARLHL